MNKKANVWVLAIVGVVAVVALVVMFQGSGTPTGDFQFNAFKPKQVQNLGVNKYSDVIMRSSRKLFIPNLSRSPAQRQQPPAQRQCQTFTIVNAPPVRIPMTGTEYCQRQGGRYHICNSEVQYTDHGLRDTRIRHNVTKVIYIGRYNPSGRGTCTGRSQTAQYIDHSTFCHEPLSYLNGECRQLTFEYENEEDLSEHPLGTQVTAERIEITCCTS